MELMYRNDLARCKIICPFQRIHFAAGAVCQCVVCIRILHLHCIHRDLDLPYWSGTAKSLLTVFFCFIVYVARFGTRRRRMQWELARTVS